MIKILKRQEYHQNKNHNPKLIKILVRKIKQTGFKSKTPKNEIIWYINKIYLLKINMSRSILHLKIKIYKKLKKNIMMDNQETDFKMDKMEVLIVKKVINMVHRITEIKR